MCSGAGPWLLMPENAGHGAGSPWFFSVAWCLWNSSMTLTGLMFAPLGYQVLLTVTLQALVPFIREHLGGLIPPPHTPSPSPLPVTISLFGVSFLGFGPLHLLFSYLMGRVGLGVNGNLLWLSFLDTSSLHSVHRNPSQKLMTIQPSKHTPKLTGFHFSLCLWNAFIFENFMFFQKNFIISYLILLWMISLTQLSYFKK